VGRLRVAARSLRARLVESGRGVTGDRQVSCRSGAAASSSIPPAPPSRETEQRLRLPRKRLHSQPGVHDPCRVDPGAGKTTGEQPRIDVFAHPEDPVGRSVVATGVAPARVATSRTRISPPGMAAPSIASRLGGASAHQSRPSRAPDRGDRPWGARAGRCVSRPARDLKARALKRARSWYGHRRRPRRSHGGEPSAPPHGHRPPG
jgi:hypothetical protein